MSKNQKPTIDLTEHITNVVFEKKDEAFSLSETLTLKEQLLQTHQKVLGIKVQSVALPPNYNPAPKTEAEVIDWLRNKVNNNYSSAYSIALKYGEKLHVKLDQNNLILTIKTLKNEAEFKRLHQTNSIRRIKN